ncbi:class I SAM-dependent methyltransferase [Priestia aryabhattai]|uniref:class I SAM-dependent methyltransferase n=1 Tax=Priestia TaxID=2800373 RepID=UPI001C8E2AC4|nr:class I SAM-dependent methyltransferase [Priestia aryabhattai]MBY0074708.1 class I SAM-dependent methyltransferase [Priestia aryabhattai]
MSIISRETFFKIFGSGSFEGKAPLFTGSDVEPLIAFSRTFYPKIIVEIGIQRGATAKCILDNSPWIERYIGIDVPPDYKASLSILQHEVPKIAGECVKQDPRVDIIVKPNGSRDVVPADLPIADLIFIDGDHTAEGVLLDTLLARQIIRKGGIICWHDYGNATVPDVTAVIDDLNKKEGDHICLIENGFLCFEFSRVGK